MTGCHWTAADHARVSTPPASSWSSGASSPRTTALGGHPDIPVPLPPQGRTVRLSRTPPSGQHAAVLRNPGSVVRVKPLREPSPAPLFGPPARPSAARPWPDPNPQLRRCIGAEWGPSRSASPSTGGARDRGCPSSGCAPAGPSRRARPAPGGPATEPGPRRLASGRTPSRPAWSRPPGRPSGRRDGARLRLLADAAAWLNLPRGPTRNLRGRLPAGRDTRGRSLDVARLHFRPLDERLHGCPSRSR
jgi:hypothetical protein